QSLGEGGKLWNEVENQNRLVALWKEIARRYANEPMIAGYDLVNEPQPTQSLEQWRGLAQRITDAIREVDKNHVVIVEKALSVNRNFNLDENLNFPDIRDDNLMYTFHIYDPIEYTHQNAAWTGFGDGGKYPDENIITPLGTVSWLAAVTGNPRAPGGSSGWNYYEGTKHRISDPKISMAKVVLAGNAVGGRVYFDDFVVKEYDPNGNFVRDVMSVKPTADKEVYFWSSNNAGKGGLTDGTGRNGGAGYYVEGTTSYANLNLDWTRFVPQQGFSYQVSGWMRGENVAGNGEANIRLDFENVDGTVARRNKAYLETSLKRFVDFAKKRNRPMYLGEYGVIAGCFEPGKGGLQWVSDMVDISLANGLHSTYHAYHEDSFGIYPGYGTPVDPAKGRRELIDLFTQKFR
nr:glycoside hydrolase family 5 protein [Cytophagales bacterium]